MAKFDRVYAKITRCKSQLSIQQEYARILAQDLRQEAELQTRSYENRLRSSMLAEHFEWADPEQVFETVRAARLAEFDRDMAFQLERAREKSEKRGDALPGQAPEGIPQLLERQAQLRQRYCAQLERDIRGQLPPASGEGKAAAEAALQEAVAQFGAQQTAAAARKEAALQEKARRRIARLERRLARAEARVKPERDGSLPDHVVLRVEDLCMYFGGIKAVDGLSFDVKAGEIFGLIGPNGAGKTTVFNCITQFYKPTSGTLLFRNRTGEVVRLTDELVHNVILQGIVRTFQNVEVVREVTVLENLLIAGHRQFTTGLAAQALHLPQLKMQERVVRERALRVLSFMGLLAYKDWYAFGLPYGVLKKIEIARTLMCNPQLIILDEPAAGLNDTETAELTQLIRRIRDEWNCTILLVEHDMGLVMEVCQTVCAISFGRLLAIGTPGEIQSNPQVQSAYLGAKDEEAV